MITVRSAGVVCLSLLFVVVSSGQSSAPRKWILSIGESSYRFLPPIIGSVTDAKVVADAFERVGFTATEKEDLDHASLKSMIEKQFVPALQPGDTAVIYFSGYGVQVDGDNYLLPSSYDPGNKDEIDGQAYSVTRLAGLLQKRKIGLTIVILDACRALPSPDPHASRAGLALMDTGPGTVFALSSLPDTSIHEDAPAKVAQAGYYARELAKVVQTPGLTASRIFQMVSDKVREDSKGTQVPLAVPNLPAEIYLVPPVPVSEARPVEVTPVAPPEQALARNDAPIEPERTKSIKPTIPVTSPQHYYYLNPSTGAAEMIEGVRQKLHVAVKALGYGGATASYELDGARSLLRLKRDRPQEFLVNRNPAGAGVPDEIFGELHRLSVTSKTRMVTIGFAGAFGAKKAGTPPIPVAITGDGPGVLKIVPVSPLPPGEYAFILAGNWGITYAGDKSGELFSFGVDPD